MYLFKKDWGKLEQVLLIWRAKVETSDGLGGNEESSRTRWSSQDLEKKGVERSRESWNKWKRLDEHDQIFDRVGVVDPNRFSSWWCFWTREKSWKAIVAWRMRLVNFEEADVSSEFKKCIVPKILFKYFKCNNYKNRLFNVDNGLKNIKTMMHISWVNEKYHPILWNISRNFILDENRISIVFLFAN